jgi:hypothetical protein
MLGLVAEIHIAGAHLPARMEHAHMRACNLLIVLAQRSAKAARAGAQGAAVHDGQRRPGAEDDTESRRFSVAADGSLGISGRESFMGREAAKRDEVQRLQECAGTSPHVYER